MRTASKLYKGRDPAHHVGNCPAEPEARNYGRSSSGETEGYCERRFAHCEGAFESELHINEDRRRREDRRQCCGAEKSSPTACKPIPDDVRKDDVGAG